MDISCCWVLLLREHHLHPQHPHRKIRIQSIQERRMFSRSKPIIAVASSILFFTLGHTSSLHKHTHNSPSSLFLLLHLLPQLLHILTHEPPSCSPLRKPPHSSNLINSFILIQTLYWIVSLLSTKTPKLFQKYHPF